MSLIRFGSLDLYQTGRIPSWTYSKADVYQGTIVLYEQDLSNRLKEAQFMNDPHLLDYRRDKQIYLSAKETKGQRRVDKMHDWINDNKCGH